MTRHDDEIDEGPTPEDVARFDSVTRTCPGCKEEVYDDTAVCWQCGRALDAEGDAKTPMWIYVAATIAMAAIVIIIFF
ncbi:MAG: hypothetical protein IPM33_05750 [Phycisphaerales bacterium]|nr:hypothetical protein [Phycisphaerales bacterium]